MTIYITQEGNKLSAEFPAQLLEKLQQLEPACAEILQDYKNQAGVSHHEKNFTPKHENGYFQVRITEPETLIAYT